MLRHSGTEVMGGEESGAAHAVWTWETCASCATAPAVCSQVLVVVVVLGGVIVLVTMCAGGEAQVRPGLDPLGRPGPPPLQLPPAQPLPPLPQPILPPLPAEPPAVAPQFPQVRVFVRENTG